MNEIQNRPDPGWARDIERVTNALLGILNMQHIEGKVYLYEHEVRQALRAAGLPVYEELPELQPVVFAFEREDEDPDPEDETLFDDPEEGVA